ESFCLPEHISWNCFLRHLLKLANDCGAAIHSFLFGGISHRHCKRRHRKNKKQFLHRSFCFANAYRYECIRTQSDMRSIKSGSHKDGTAIHVVTPSDILMTLDVKPKP